MVCCNGFSSSCLDVKLLGIPQGSVIGPIFLIYINDLVYRSNFRTTLYADDSVLTLSNKNTISFEENLNQELCKINDWLKFNHLFLNTAKTKFLFFTKTKSDTSLSIMMNSGEIDRTDCVKYLRVYLDDKLNW